MCCWKAFCLKSEPISRPAEIALPLTIIACAHTTSFW